LYSNSDRVESIVQPAVKIVRPSLSGVTLNMSFAAASVTSLPSKTAMANRARSFAVEMIPLAGVLKRVSTTSDGRSP